LKVCLETGTFLGEAAKELAKNPKRTIPIEGDYELFEPARLNFAGLVFEVWLCNCADLIDEAIRRVLKNEFPQINFTLDDYFSD
jgi:hypothetical protein